MKNMKCYGRKKVIVPKEKSFIKNFFDGNESSDFSTKGLSFNAANKDQRVDINQYKKNRCRVFDSPSSFFDNCPVEQKKDKRSVAELNFDKDEKANSTANKENTYCLFESPGLFSNDLSMEQKKSHHVKFVTKPQPSVKNRVKRNKYAKKKAKGIQHLSTKYCKSLQPCWEEFEKHNLDIERPRKTYLLASTEQHNSEMLINIEQCPQNFPCASTSNNEEADQVVALPCETPISEKRLKTVSSKLSFPSNATFESSSDLFIKAPKYGKDLRKKKTKKKSRLKKQSDAQSYNTVTKLEEKINQCMENVDLSNINSKVSNSGRKVNCAVLPNDSSFSALTLHLQETVPISNLTTVPVAQNEVHNIETSPYFQQTLTELPNTCLKDRSYFNKENFASYELPISSNDKNVSESILHKDHQFTVSSKSQKTSQTKTIQNSEHLSVSRILTLDKVSKEPVCFYEKEQPSNQPIFFKEKKSTEVSSNFFHEPNLFEKNCGSLSKNISSLHLEEKILKNSNYTKNGSYSHILSPDVSTIIQTHKPFGVKCKGKFATSTPVTTKKRIQDFVNTEVIVLRDDENISESKICSEKQDSFCEKVIKSECLMTVAIETPINSFINNLNKSASITLPKSPLCAVSPDLHKSRTSLSTPHKSIIHSASHKKCQSLLNLSSIVSEKEKSDGDITKSNLLKLCDQDSVISFAEVYNWKDFKVKKIGEGTYGEVFMLSKGKISSVLKVIPISEDPNDKNLQGLSSVYSEVKISKSLSELRCNQMNQSKNFVKVIRSSVVSGSYPAALMNAWDDFCKDRSTYNDRPDIYSKDQLFVILELAYGGKDMSYITLRNAVEAEIIIKQIAVSLAVAEEEFSFEHRDLHLGNILVKRSRSKNVSYKIRGKDISFQSHGLQVTIIDFTLSLLSDKGYIYYYDLAEDSLFDQSGDYQFDVYKSMRRHLENKWEECSLYSNVLWLKYLCKKMKEFKFTHPTAVTHKRGLKAIDSFNSQLINCSCALECLDKCGITKTVFKRSKSVSPRRSVLVSRNSIQKSKLSMC